MTPGMLRELKSGKVAPGTTRKSSKRSSSSRLPATLFLTGLWIETYPRCDQGIVGRPAVRAWQSQLFARRVSFPLLQPLSDTGIETNRRSAKDRRSAQEIRGILQEIFPLSGTLLRCAGREDGRRSRLHRDRRRRGWRRRLREKSEMDCVRCRVACPSGQHRRSPHARRPQRAGNGRRAAGHHHTGSVPTDTLSSKCRTC